LINAGLLNRKNSIDILEGLDLDFLQLKGRNRGISTDSTFSYSGFDDDFFFDGQFNEGSNQPTTSPTFGEDILALDAVDGPIGRKNSLDLGANKNFRANSLIDNSIKGGIGDGKTDSSFEMGDMNFEWGGYGGGIENRHNSFQGFGIEADLTPGMNIDMSAYEFLAASLQDTTSKPRKRHTKTGDNSESKSNLKNNLKTSGLKANSTNSTKANYNKSQTNKSQTNLTKSNSTTSKVIIL
jgi:hypothetical protein